MAMVHYIWRWLIIMGSGESKKLTMKLTRINKVVSTIPSEGLPKNLTIGSGIARASILNGDYDEESADQVIQPNFPTFRFEFFLSSFWSVVRSPVVARHGPAKSVKSQIKFAILRILIFW